MIGAYLALQALGEYAALQGGGPSLFTSAKAWMEDAANWAMGHRTLLIAAAVLGVLLILVPKRSSP